jgi:hypothetical protein
MIRVYIASPYTLGDVAVNVKKQIDAAEELMNLGFAPYVPLLCHFHHLIHPHLYQEWTEQVSEWIICCNAVLRLPGKSGGADAEVAYAKTFNIPVFESINALRSKFRTTSK